MSEVNIQAVPVIAPNIQMALDYSRNFATAKPNIGLTEKEHIEGLANLLERTALENSGLQQRLTAADERVDVMTTALSRIQFRCQSFVESDWAMAVESVEAVLSIAEAALKPAEVKCKTCNGTRIVSDGAMYCSSGGIPFECGPIERVKDCPDCSKP